MLFKILIISKYDNNQNTDDNQNTNNTFGSGATDKKIIVKNFHIS